MTSKVIRVGVVGASLNRGPDTAAHTPWATAALIPALQALDQYELTAVSTTRLETAQATADHFGVPLAFGNANEMISHPDIDLVVVSVRAPRHHALVMSALEAKKHVFCEWPLGATTAQAEEMANLAATTGVANAVGLQARYAPAFRQVRELVEDGFVGRVLSANLNFATPTWGDTAEKPITYLDDRANGATLLSIYGGHSFDALAHCLGEFSEVSAVISTQFPEAVVVETGEVIQKTSPDQVALVGTLANGTVVSCHFQGGVHTLTGVSLEIRGTEGNLVLSTPTIIEIGPYTLRGSRGRGGDLKDLPVPSDDWAIPADRDLPLASRNVSELLGAFAHAIQDNAPFAEGTNFQVALRRHRLLDAIELAASTGQRQPVPA